MHRRKNSNAKNQGAKTVAEILTELPGPVRFTRSSPSWGTGLQIVAGPNEPHIEQTDAGPAVYLGRRTRNLLDAAFAPFVGVPGGWQGHSGVSFRGDGKLDIDASAGPVSLCLPPMRVDPAAELLDEGTSYVGVLYQISGYLSGEGIVLLALHDRAHGLSVEKTVKVAGDGLRPCIALDGPLEPRTLEAAMIVKDGHVTMRGLMLEPFVTTHRTGNSSALFPCPGGWVPGGQRRDRDRLEVHLPAGSIPRSGMIDFWFKPDWDAAHPHHVFFEMAHWYFSFAMDTQAPLFHAGQRPCPWPYYWEWCTGQEYRGTTWQHYATVWNEDGLVTIYLDGQARACVQQVEAHALDPQRMGKRMVIGGPLRDGMFTDPNVSGELDGFLRSFRLTAGQISAEGVLVAMEETDPRPRQRAAPPEKAFFLLEGERSLVASDEGYCWFPQRIDKVGNQLELYYAISDDCHPGKHLRPRPGKAVAVSEDQGRTWRRTSTLATAFPFGVLSDGRFCYVEQSFTEDQKQPFHLRLVDSKGGEERFQASVDMAGFNGGRIPYALIWLLPLLDGTHLLFAYSNWPGESKSSVTVLASDDLRHWRAIAAPLRADGRTEGGYNETAAAQFPNGRIMTMTRTGGWNQALVKCFSDDNGRTWTSPLPSGVYGVDPKFHLSADGTLFLVTGRPGIILAVSHDFGESFETCVCAEDDRIHEMVDHFGWYGYSTMNNGLLVDESSRTVHVSYDLLGVRSPQDGTSRNACYVKHYPYLSISDYRRRVKAVLATDASPIRREGSWQTVNGRLTVTTQTGASLTGEFDGNDLVAILETSPNGGVALVRVDDGEERRIPLYYPRRSVQRRLLAHNLGGGVHRFRLALESGCDPEHKFANPEMPMLGGPQTSFLAGVTGSRRLAVYGLEVLT